MFVNVGKYHKYVSLQCDIAREAVQKDALAEFMCLGDGVLAFSSPSWLKNLACSWEYDQIS